MKYIAVPILTVAVAMCFADDECYTTKFDNIDLDEIFTSGRLFKNYYKCLMDMGRCTPEGTEIKRVLSDALETDCSKCSEKQRIIVEKAIRLLSKNYPNEYAALQGKYDAEHKYTTEKWAESKICH